MLSYPALANKSIGKHSHHITSEPTNISVVKKRRSQHDIHQKRLKALQSEVIDLDANGKLMAPGVSVASGAYNFPKTEVKQRESQTRHHDLIRVSHAKHLSSISKNGARTNTVTSPDIYSIRREQQRVQSIINNTLGAKTRLRKVQDENDNLAKSVAQVYGNTRENSITSPDWQSVGGRLSASPSGGILTGRNDFTSATNGLSSRRQGGDISVEEEVETYKVRKEVTYMEEDNSPDYLLPSNGGYNPKKKSVYVDETMTRKVKKVESPSGTITYVEEP